jgi:hypothetical protein
MTIRNAVPPLATMLVSGAGALDDLDQFDEARRGVEQEKEPGINETTAEKATAAKGRCCDRRPASRGRRRACRRRAPSRRNRAIATRLSRVEFVS